MHDEHSGVSLSQLLKWEAPAHMVFRITGSARSDSICTATYLLSAEIECYRVHRMQNREHLAISPYMVHPNLMKKTRWRPCCSTPCLRRVRQEGFPYARILVLGTVGSTVFSYGLFYGNYYFPYRDQHKTSLFIEIKISSRVRQPSIPKKVSYFSLREHIQAQFKVLGLLLLFFAFNYFIDIILLHFEANTSNSLACQEKKEKK